MWAWGPVTNLAARTLASWLCTLRGRHEGAPGGGGGRLLPGCGTSWVGRPPTPDRPSLGRAAGAHYPPAAGAGGVGVGTRHLPHSVPSCEMALRAVGAALYHCTNYCGTCEIPLMHFRISAVVRLPPIRAILAAVRPTCGLTAQVRIPQ